MKYYKVEKLDTKSEKEWNLGTYNEKDAKLITRGYTFNGLFYTRKNSRYIYTVEEVQ